MQNDVKNAGPAPDEPVPPASAEAEKPAETEKPAEVEKPAEAVQFRAQVQIRYRSKPANAEIALAPDGSVTIRFEVPQRAVTPGQVAVIYDSEILLGGGMI